MVAGLNVASTPAAFCQGMPTGALQPDVVCSVLCDADNELLASLPARTTTNLPVAGFTASPGLRAESTVWQFMPSKLSAAPAAMYLIVQSGTPRPPYVFQLGHTSRHAPPTQAAAGPSNAKSSRPVPSAEGAGQMAPSVDVAYRSLSSLMSIQKRLNQPWPAL